MRPLYVSVIGGSSCSPAEYEQAREVGRLIAKEGAVLVCGGLGGVMEAAARGAKEAGGTTLGILPGHDRAAANPYLDYVVTTGLGHARNLAVVSTGDAVIAVSGAYGTLSEIGLAGVLGKPVIILGGWYLQNASLGEALVKDVRYATSPREAIDLLPEVLARQAGSSPPTAAL